MPASNGPLASGPRNSRPRPVFNPEMKTLSFLCIIALCLVAPTAPLALAQNQPNADGRGARWQQKLAGLSAAEREQLRTAHCKAVPDPAVRAAQIKMRQAHRDFREAMRSSMLKADPTIQPILNKIPEARARRDS